MDKARYLLLENGTVFEGKAFGAEGDVTGEVVFTTAMTGYLETLTDPSHWSDCRSDFSAHRKLRCNSGGL